MARLATLVSATLVLACISQTAADYEHQCSAEDYGGRRRNKVSICGRRLTTQIIRMCARWGPNRRKRDLSSILRVKSYKPKSPPSITMNKEKANAFLRPRKFRSGNTGVVCECCINRCSVSEIRQYCGEGGVRIRNSRRRRSIHNPKQSPFLLTDEDLDAFYDELENIDEDKEESMTIYDLENSSLVRLIEKQKEININKNRSYKRNSDEEHQEEEKNSKGKENLLENYLRSKFNQLLSRSKAAKNADNSEEQQQLTSEEEDNLKQLWEMFRTEMENLD